MNSTLKRLLNLLFIIAIFLLVLALGFKSYNPKSILETILKLPVHFFALLIFAWISYMIVETISLKIFFKMQSYKVSFFRLFYVTIIGNYYSSITPAATGGQPVQIYYLKKSGVPIGVSTSVLAIRFFIYQLALLVIGTSLWLFNSELIKAQLGRHIWLLYIGYIMNSITVLAVLFLSLSRRVVRFIVHGIINILHKIHLIKNNEKYINKADNAIDSFNKSVTLIRNDPMQLIIQFILCCIQFIAIFSIPVILHYIFGNKDYGVIDVFTITTLLFITTSYTPLPGSSGAQEGGFALFFKNIFIGNSLFSSLLLWRFCSYYTTLILGFIFSLFTIKKSKSYNPQSEINNIDNDLETNKI